MTKRWIYIGLASLLSAYAGFANDVASPVGMSDLDALVGRWMTLRTTIADEKQEWDLRREQWENEIQLLEIEDAKLDVEIGESSRFATSVDKERAAAIARKEVMESVLQELRPVLDRAESELKRWENRIPAALRQKLGSGFDALPANQAEADRQPMVKRARTVAALYTQIESLQHELHMTCETLDVGSGKRRQVDVLYIGLARAFAVSPGNDWTAVGTPGIDGWEWHPQIDQTANIRTSIDLLNRRKTAKLVNLPMQVSKEVTP